MLGAPPPGFDPCAARRRHGPKQTSITSAAPASRVMPYVEYDEIEAICPECGRVFLSEEALELHRQDSHAGLEEKPPKPPARRAHARPAPK